MLARTWFEKWGVADFGQMLLSTDGRELTDLLKSGDRVRTRRLVTVREEQRADSDELAILPVGTFLLILDVRGNELVKVAGCSFEGWITLPFDWLVHLPFVLMPRQRRIQRAQASAPGQSVGDLLADNFVIGGVYKVRSAATVRSDESLDSDFVTELLPGMQVQILELGTCEQRRGKIRYGCLTGWLSLATRKGELLLHAETNERFPNCMSVCRWARLETQGNVASTWENRPTPLEVALAFSIIADYQSSIKLRRDNVQNLPTFVFGSGSPDAAGKFEPTCSVCLQDLDAGEMIKQLPCEHVFHACCIDRWLEKGDACPFRCHVNLSQPQA